MQIYRDYLNILVGIGIKKGDVLYLASDLLKTIILFNKKKRKFDFDIFINTLIFCLGNNGTLIVPTFNWDFCVGKIFDIKKTKSKCGSLSNFALNRRDFKRTKHPIYSFAVQGKYQNYLCKLNNKSAWGKNSPFNFLYKIKAKNLFIGIDYKKAFTMDHYFEQIAKVRYRYHKKFISNYIDENNKKEKKEYSMYVRKEEICDFTVLSSKLDKVLKQKNILSIVKKNSTMFSLIDINKAGKLLIKDLQKKKKNIYPVKLKINEPKL